MNLLLCCINNDVAGVTKALDEINGTVREAALSEEVTIEEAIVLALCTRHAQLSYRELSVTISYCI